MLDVDEHEKWMHEAFREAEKAFEANEVPVGAVVVSGGRIVGRGFNRMEALHDATAHAEILAITAASDTRQTWRLERCRLYVTLEPCIMCAGAILNARIGKVVYGASDSVQGACGSVFNLVQDPRSIHHTDVVSGVLAERCRAILTSFFKNIRTKSGPA